MEGKEKLRDARSFETLLECSFRGSLNRANARISK